METPLFKIESLSKSYPGKDVLADLSFEVYRGECFVILGRSGSGKSVALRLLVANAASVNPIVGVLTTLGCIGVKETLILISRSAEFSGLIH